MSLARSEDLQAGYWEDMRRFVTEDFFFLNHGQEKASLAEIGQEQTGGDQKLEDYDRIFGDMQFGNMSEQVNTRAPLLFELLNGLMAPKIERKDRALRDPAKFNYRIAIITSIFCYS